MTSLSLLADRTVGNMTNDKPVVNCSGFNSSHEILELNVYSLIVLYSVCLDAYMQILNRRPYSGCARAWEHACVCEFVWSCICVVLYLCLRAAKVLFRFNVCAGPSEPSLLAIFSKTNRNDSFTK